MVGSSCKFHESKKAPFSRLLAVLKVLVLIITIASMIYAFFYDNPYKRLLEAKRSSLIGHQIALVQDNQANTNIKFWSAFNQLYVKQVKAQEGLFESMTLLDLSLKYQPELVGKKGDALFYREIKRDPKLSKNPIASLLVTASSMQIDNQFFIAKYDAVAKSLGIPGWKNYVAKSISLAIKMQSTMKKLNFLDEKISWQAGGHLVVKKETKVLLKNLSVSLEEESVGYLALVSQLIDRQLTAS